MKEAQGLLEAFALYGRLRQITLMKCVAAKYHSQKGLFEHASHGVVG